MNKKYFLEILTILSWTYLFGELASSLLPGATIFILAAIVVGATLGILSAWGLRIVLVWLKNNSKQDENRINKSK